MSGRFLIAASGAAAVLAVAALVLADGAAKDARPAFQSGYAPVNGLKMYYEVHGSGDGPPLVLLHGGGSTIETSFGKVLPLLAKTRKIIAIEQQGHGHTNDIADRPYTFEQSADDTAELLKQLHVEQADFFGYSNGGHIALEMATRHPEMVRKLVVESAMVKRDGAPPEFWQGFAHATLANMPAELREAYLKVAPDPNGLQMMHDKCVQRMVAFKDWPTEQIRSIAAPTLIMTGDGDLVRPEHAVEMFRMLPHAQLAILPGTDHMAMPDRADWQASMIGPFLDAPMPRQK
jgi:pimeloyl-ACP methyl ester carboxylesterase